MAVELVYHASKGHKTEVTRLLEAGIHPDACNSNGETALFHAVLAGKIATAKVLLKYGADPNRCSENGLTPVNACCLQDNVKALALLVKYGGNLDQADNSTNESAFVSAHRYNSTKIIKYITKRKEDAIKNYRIGEDFIGDDESFETKQNANKLRKMKEFPGDFASLPCIDIEELKTLHDGKRFSFSAPHVIFRSGIWHRIEVTIKSLSKMDYAGNMKREMELLRVLRHPNVAYLLAVITGPTEDQITSILEHFHLGSLNHILHHSDQVMNLFERLHVLADISKAMVYLHNLNIIHCYINSYSVLLQGKCQAKLGNFEHAQKGNKNAANAFDEFSGVVHIVHQHPWMCWEDLSGYPASKYGDVYSFGALLWECLTKHIPWFWLGNKTVIVAVCEEGLQLPIPKELPDYITDVLSMCLGMEEERPDFCWIKEQLDRIKTSTWVIKTHELDYVIDEWLHGKAKRKVSSRERTISGPLASKISWRLSSFSIGNIDLNNEDESKVRVLCSRRKSSMTTNVKRRRKTVDAGLARALNGLHCSKNQVRFERDVDNYGIEIAEQLSFVRGIWKRAKSHTRHRWAKDVTIRRKLEGDIERVNIQKRNKERNQKQAKGAGPKQGRRIRRLSHGAESIAKLRTIASKYGKWDWARYTTGHAYFLPQEKYEMLSEEEYDDDDVEHVPMETGGTFVQYQGGENTGECQIVPYKIRGINLGQIAESQLGDSDSSYEMILHDMERGSDEEVVQEHWKTKVDEQGSEINEKDNKNRKTEKQEVEMSSTPNRDFAKNSNNEPDKILDEFNCWLATVAENNNSTNTPTGRVPSLDAELVSRQYSRKEFIEKQVNKYNSQLLLYKDTAGTDDYDQNETSLVEDVMDTYDDTTKRDLVRSFSSFIESSSNSTLSGRHSNSTSKSEELGYDKSSDSNASDSVQIQSQNEEEMIHNENEQPMIKQEANNNQLANSEELCYDQSSDGNTSDSIQIQSQIKEEMIDNENEQPIREANDNQLSNSLEAIQIPNQNEAAIIHKEIETPIATQGAKENQLSNEKTETTKQKLESSYVSRERTTSYGPSDKGNMLISQTGKGHGSQLFTSDDQDEQMYNDGHTHAQILSKSSLTIVSNLASWISSSGDSLEIDRGDHRSMLKASNRCSPKYDRMVSPSLDNIPITSVSTGCSSTQKCSFSEQLSIQKQLALNENEHEMQSGATSHAEQSSTDSEFHVPDHLSLRKKSKMSRRYEKRVDSRELNTSKDLELRKSSDEPDISPVLDSTQQNNDKVSYIGSLNVKLSSNDSYTYDEEEFEREISDEVEFSTQESLQQNEGEISFVENLSPKDSWLSKEEEDLENVSSDEDKDFTPVSQQNEGEMPVQEDAIEGKSQHGQFSIKHTWLEKIEEDLERESSSEEEYEDCVAQDFDGSITSASITSSSRSSSGLLELVNRYSYRRDDTQQNRRSSTSAKINCDFEDDSAV